MNPKIYTIGYGNRSIHTFIQLLTKYQVDILIDVRTTPYSRYQPDFRNRALELHLINYGMKYLHLGDELGGKPSDPSCYTDGTVDYDKVASKLFFIRGIEEIKTLNAEGFTVAVMCAEQSPARCHRKLLIGDYLEEQGYEILHIDKDGTVLNELF
jgi:uncharacterized protein (DUF488 family)